MGAVKIKKKNDDQFLQDQALIAAIYRSQAVIEFGMDGKVLTANDKFLKAMGYELTDIVGHHHSIFCEPEFTESPSYKQFWERKISGIFQKSNIRQCKNSIWRQT